MCKQNNLYEQFLKYSYYDLKELFKKAKTKEEQDFYIALLDLILQKEQEKVIRKEIVENSFKVDPVSRTL